MRRWWVGALTLAVLAAGVGSAVVLRDREVTLPRISASPDASPDPVRTPLLARLADDAAAPTPDGVRLALAAVLRDRALGSRLALSVVDAATGRPVLEAGATRPSTPASTAKIVTALAALSVLRPDSRLTTRVVRGAGQDVVLIGGGDPTLAGRFAEPGFPRSARLADLAAALRSVPVARVVVDDALFSGPGTGPGWKANYVPDGDVAPVSALAVDHGRTSAKDNTPRTTDPALAAGRQLAALLGGKPVVRGRAPAGAAELATVSSPAVSDLVESMLIHSDNDLAEALGRHVALATRLPATFEGVAAALDAALAPLLRRAGAAPVGLGLRDASGLSVLDRLRPATVSRLLAVASRDPRFGPLLSGLPVAGFDGTLENRYRKGPEAVAAGQVRAKTGTLDGVSALAGLVRTRGGRLLAFDLTADGVALGGTRASQAALDRVAAALAGCGCP